MLNQSTYDKLVTQIVPIVYNYPKIFTVEIGKGASTILRHLISTYVLYS